MRLFTTLSQKKYWEAKNHQNSNQASLSELRLHYARSGQRSIQSKFKVILNQARLNMMIKYLPPARAKAPSSPCRLCMTQTRRQYNLNVPSKLKTSIHSRWESPLRYLRRNKTTLEIVQSTPRKTRHTLPEVQHHSGRQTF